MRTATIDDLAAALIQARRDHTALDAAGWAGLLQEAGQAYAVQDLVARALHGESAPVAAHWKSGGASRDAVLTHAALAPAGVRASPANLAHLHFHTPAIEAEVALRLGCSVSPAQAADLRHEEAVALVDALAVSIEIVDTRWRDAAAASALLRLADAQSHGALVLGDWQPWSQRDWTAQRVEVRINGGAPLERTGSHPLGDPVWGLPTWLRHATRHGHTVPAGTVVTTGAWTGVVPVARGDVVEVAFPGIGAAATTI